MKNESKENKIFLTENLPYEIKNLCASSRLRRFYECRTRSQRPEWVQIRGEESWNICGGWYVSQIYNKFRI